MQAQLYFFDDTKSDDYDPSTALKVISDIRNACLGYFEEMASELEAEDGKAALRASRIAGSGDAKLTAEDIRAWDALVRGRLLPWHQDMIDKLQHERDTGSAQPATAYNGMIGNIADKIAWIERVHGTFMEGFDQALETFPSSMSEPKI
jgi:hypothetical protein